MAAEVIRPEILERLATADAGSGPSAVGMLVFDTVAATRREMPWTLIEARDDAVGVRAEGSGACGA